MCLQANQSPQSISPTKKLSAQGMVLKTVLIKIVTEILFGNAPLANHETTVLAADHRPAFWKDRDLDQLGSLTTANWVSLDFNVSYSSCWGYSKTVKSKKIVKGKRGETCGSFVTFRYISNCHTQEMSRNARPQLAPPPTCQRLHCL